MGQLTNLALYPTVRYNKPRSLPHCQAQQTSPCAQYSNTTNLAPRPTVRHSKPRYVRTGVHSKPHPVSHCQAQQTSPHVPLQAQQTSVHAPLSITANLALCPTVRHNKSHPVPHCQAHSANLAPRPTVRHSKHRPVPHSLGCCHLANSMACHPRAKCHIAECCHLANYMPCHPTATCHIAGCCHLRNSMSWSRATLLSGWIPPAILKIVIRRILFYFCFPNAILALTISGFRIVSDTVLNNASISSQHAVLWHGVMLRITS